MRYLVILIIGLVGCPRNIPTPKPQPVPDTASCGDACANLNRLGCPEGAPLEDGTSCKKFCEDTQNQGHALNALCVSKITKCSELESQCQPSHASGH